MFDFAIERALRRLAEDAETGREIVLQAIVRDWLIEHRCFEASISNVVEFHPRVKNGPSCERSALPH